MSLTSRISEPSAALSRPGRAYSFGSTPWRDGFSRSIATIAASTVSPIVGCGACALTCSQRALGGTQKMRTARYSSGSSGVSAPSSRSASRRAGGAPQRRRRCTSGRSARGRRACTRPRPCCYGARPPCPRVSSRTPGSPRRWPLPSSASRSPSRPPACLDPNQPIDADVSVESSAQPVACAVRKLTRSLARAPDAAPPTCDAASRAG